MSLPHSSSTKTCWEKWETLSLKTGTYGRMAVELAGKLYRGLSLGIRSKGVVPLQYSSGLSCCRGVPVETTSMSCWRADASACGTRGLDAVVESTHRLGNSDPLC